MTTGLYGRWPDRKIVVGVGGSGFDISGQFSGRFDFSHWTLVCIRTRVAECPTGRTRSLTLISVRNS